MLTSFDLARAYYQLRRAAANDDRIGLIRATVTINAATSSNTYPAIGFSAAAIEASARERYGDEPVGVSVMVHADLARSASMEI